MKLQNTYFVNDYLQCRYVLCKKCINITHAKCKSDINIIYKIGTVCFVAIRV